jgi:hypothetical protein
MNLELRVVSFDVGVSSAPENDEIALTNHVERVEKTVEDIIKNFSPSIFCLQQFDCLKCGASEVIAQVLFENNFTIIASNNTQAAIAYAVDAFVIEGLDNPYETFPSVNPFITNDSKSDQMPKPGVCLQLTHAATGVRVRIVSDRVLQFDAAKQKAAKKPLSRKISRDVLKNNTGHNGRLNWLLSQKETSLPALGDAAVEQSLDLVEPDDKTELVIYGVNAHATAKYVSSKKRRRLHPLRLRLFEIRDYVMDKKDKRPTTCDAGCKRKYDYVLVKAASKSAKISIENQIIQGVNNRQLFDSGLLRSGEHLPVLSIIKYSKK